MQRSTNVYRTTFCGNSSNHLRQLKQPSAATQATICGSSSGVASHAPQPPSRMPQVQCWFFRYDSPDDCSDDQHATVNEEPGRGCEEPSDAAELLHIGLDVRGHD